MNDNIAKTELELMKLNEKINNPKSRISKEKEYLKKKVDGILKGKYISEIIEVKIADQNVEFKINEEKKSKLKRGVYCVKK